jgi:hypothetical protein
LAIGVAFFVGVILSAATLANYALVLPLFAAEINVCRTHIWVTTVQIRVLNSPGKPGLPLYLQGFILDSIF